MRLSGKPARAAKPARALREAAGVRRAASARAARVPRVARVGRRGLPLGGAPRHGDWVGAGEDLIDRALANVSHGRFERSLSGLTAAAAVITTAEIYIEHYKASFGNKWMWSPILVTPPVVVTGIGGVFSRRWAKRWLPIAAGLYTANGLLGEYLHARGVARKPGGWQLASYNVPMGPPIAAPGLMTIVGAMGLLAAVLRREK